MNQPPVADSRLTLRRAEPGRWIAIETAGLYGSVAVAEVTTEACQIVASKSLRRDARSAQTLAPAMQSLLEGVGWEPTSLAAVAVSVGPGSFTGLRVGVATAKTFAYATGAAVLGIDTLDALSEAAPQPAGAESSLWPVLDAQRGELFTAHFAAKQGSWERDEPTQRLTREALAERASAGDLMIGPTAETLAELGAFGTLNAVPNAAAVLAVAWREWKSGAVGNAFALAPAYHRLSAAEEKLKTSNA